MLASELSDNKIAEKDGFATQGEFMENMSDYSDYVGASYGVVSIVLGLLLVFAIMRLFTLKHKSQAKKNEK
jgi:heme exporter protein D